MLYVKLNIQRFAATATISATETDVNIESNTSYVNLTITLTTTGQTYNETSGPYVNATLTGQNNTLSIPQTSFSIGRNTTKVIYSGKVGPFTHNSDGSLNPVEIKATIRVTPNTSTSASGSCLMSTIKRASSPSATNGAVEGTINIYTNKLSNFTHTLKYSFQGLTGTIATGVVDMYAWKVPTSFYDKLANTHYSTTTYGTITCETYSGGTFIGSKTCQFGVTIDINKCRPTISATLKDINPITIALTGNEKYIVKGYSNVQITPSAVAKNSATIKSITVDGRNASNNTAITINGAQKNTFDLVAIDSRSIQTSVPSNVSGEKFIDYVPLTCNAEFYRISQTGSEVKVDISGNYFDSSFGKTENSLTLKWYYRKRGESDWIDGETITPELKGNTYSASLDCGSTFDYQTEYEFRVTYEDKLITNGEMIKLLPKGLGAFEIFDGAVRMEGMVLFYDDEKFKQNEDGSFSKV